MLTWSHNAGNLNSENFNLFQKFLGEDAPRTCQRRMPWAVCISDPLLENLPSVPALPTSHFLNKDFTRQEAGRKILKEMIQLFQLTIE